MNLLLDIGNSRCKFSILKNAEPPEYGAKIYSSNDKVAEIKPLLQNNKEINKVIVSSVLNDQFNQKLIEAFNENRIDNYYFLNPSEQTFGIQLCYKRPEDLGADRLAVMIAAYAKYKVNTCIVDCGTAVTIDAIDDQGRHQGGVILPSIMSMQQALSRETEINFSECAGSYNVLPNSTQDAIYSGCISAVAGGIEYAVSVMQKHGTSFDKIIITGGDAEKILPMLGISVKHEPKLVLDGLTFIMSEL